MTWELSFRYRRLLFTLTAMVVCLMCETNRNHVELAFNLQS